MSDIRNIILDWADQFENDHYEFNMYGMKYTVDLPRETVEAVLDIAITLVDRVVAAKGELHTADYEELEKKVLGCSMEEKNAMPDAGDWLFDLIVKATFDERLFGRYKDIEPMIGKLMSQGLSKSQSTDTAAYLLMVRPEIHKLIYATIRHVDDVEEVYDSLVYTFFLGVLAKCWGEGNGWSKEKNGDNVSWKWSSAE